MKPIYFKASDRLDYEIEISCRKRSMKKKDFLRVAIMKEIEHIKNIS